MEGVWTRRVGGWMDEGGGGKATVSMDKPQ